MEHAVIISDCDANLPVGEVFDRLFDAIVMIASESDVVTVDNKNINNKLLNACLEFYCLNCGHKVLSNSILDYIFELKDDNIDVWQSLSDFLDKTGGSDMKQPIMFFVDEMICNIQQHSKADKGLLYYWYSTDNDAIDICIADNGISILGSYVEHQLYLDIVGDSDAQAVALAKEGYSTKNLPDAENRGYGISSNINMIVNGLKGSMYMLSGTALMMCQGDDKKILSMPVQTEWNGTLVFAEIPLKKPETFNFYNFIG